MAFWPSFQAWCMAQGVPSPQTRCCKMQWVTSNGPSRASTASLSVISFGWRSRRDPPPRPSRLATRPARDRFAEFGPADGVALRLFRDGVGGRQPPPTAPGRSTPPNRSGPRCRARASKNRRSFPMKWEIHPARCHHPSINYFTSPVIGAVSRSSPPESPTRTRHIRPTSSKSSFAYIYLLFM